MIQYQEDTKRTVSDSIHPDKVDADYLVHILYVAMKAIKDVELAKKSLFYGRDLPNSLGDRNAMLAGTGSAEYRRVPTNLIHSIMGIVGEAGELAEHLYDTLQGKRFPVEHDKLLLEYGNHLWYHALAYNELGTDFETVGRQNIAKLKARYPNKFENLELECVHS